MIKKILRKLWVKSPPSLRYMAIRLVETRFMASVGGIITNEKGQVLLLRHVFRPGSGWGIPGGFMSGKEQPEEALRRELEEEIGLQLENIQLVLVHTFEKFNHIEIIFLANACGEEAEIRSMEISQIGWFSIEDIPDDINPEQLKLIKSVLKDGEIQ